MWFLTRHLSFVVLLTCYIPLLSCIAGKLDSPLEPTSSWLGGCIKYGNNMYEYYSYSKSLNSVPNYEDKCVKKVDNKYFCQNDTEKLVFVCEATRSPIVWKLQIQFETEYATMSNLSKGEPRLVDKIYKGIVIVPCQHSGPPVTLLECSYLGRKSKASLSSNIYAIHRSTLGWDSGSPQQLFSWIGTGTNNHFETYHYLLLPCCKKIGNETLRLEKQTKSKYWMQWAEPLFFNGEVNYDPLVGFVIKIDLVDHTKLIGLYRCVKDGETVYAKYNIKFEINYLDDFESATKLDGNASVSLQLNMFIPERPEIQLRCCSGVKDKPPSLNAFGCLSNRNCGYRKWPDSEGTNVQAQAANYNSSTDCNLKTLYAPLYRVHCKADNLNFSQTYVTVFHDLANSSVLERKNKILTADGIRNSSKAHVAALVRYHNSNSRKPIPTRSKMFITFAKLIDNHQTIDGHKSFSFKTRFDQMLLQNLTNPTSTPFSSKNDQRILPSLQEYSSEEFYQGDPITVVCLGWQLFYVEGVKLVIKWKNGMVSELEQESFVDRLGRQDLYLQEAIFSFDQKGLLFYGGISKVIKASKNMVSVECYMPMIGSVNVDSLERQLNVKK